MNMMMNKLLLIKMMMMVMMITILIIMLISLLIFYHYLFIIILSGKKVLSTFPYKKMTDDTKKAEEQTGKKGKKNDTQKDSKKTKNKANTAITSLFVHHQNNNNNQDSKYYVFIGCKDGSVSIYDASNLSNKQLSPTFIYTFDIHNIAIVNDHDGLGMSKYILLPQIQSISIFNNNNGGDSGSSSSIGSGKKQSDDEVMLVCLSTRSCDILEVIVNLDVMSQSTTLYKSSSSKSLSIEHHDLSSGIIIQSHFSDELWGISTHPLLPYYCSVGDDKTLRFYSIHHRTMIKCINIGSMARTCCYNMDGNYVAVGFGGRLGKGMYVTTMY